MRNSQASDVGTDPNFGSCKPRPTALGRSTSGSLNSVHTAMSRTVTPFSVYDRKFRFKTLEATC